MPNTLFAISAPSGCGKTSIMRELMDNEILSFTTREKRKTETDGIDYQFISFSDFVELKDNGRLIEETNYYGNWYGITTAELSNKIRNGNAFAIVDFNGMKQLKAIYPDTVSIFIKASQEDAIRNMIDRGDSFENIKKRLVAFDEELLNRIDYDYVVTNRYGYFDETINIVHSIIASY